MAYIEKEPIIKFITDGLNNPDKSKAFGHDAIEILTEIEFAPAADVVEVVRCKDCKLRYTEDCPAMFWDCSGELMGDTEDNDFCSYGERKHT